MENIKDIKKRLEIDEKQLELLTTITEAEDKLKKLNEEFTFAVDNEITKALNETNALGKKIYSYKEISTIIGVGVSKIQKIAKALKSQDK